MIKNKKLWTINFGHVLNQVMYDLDVTQKELSEKTGIRQSTISEYINGKYAPSITSVVAIAQALGVEYHVLLDVEDYYGPQKCEYDIYDVVTEYEWLKDFSFRLRILLSSERVSQSYLSELTGISQYLISRYIKGDIIPSAFAVVRIAQELAYDDDYAELLDFGTLRIDRCR